MVDILGLGAVMPLIALVVDPNLINSNPYLTEIFILSQGIGVTDAEEFLLLTCGVTVLAFLTKAMIGLQITRVQSRFGFSVAHRLAGQMWDAHFKESLETMRGSNTGLILAQINNWPIQFANVFMVGSLILLSEFTVISLIILGLLIYQPLVIASVGSLLTAGTLVVRKLTKTKLDDYSQQRQILDPRSGLFITNAVRGFLEILTFQAESTVRKSYLKERKIVFNIQSNSLVLGLLPAKLFEVLAVSAIVVSIYLAISLDVNRGEFVALLSLMALTAYRIMPSMSRINAALMNIRANNHLLEAMEWGHQISSQTKQESPSSFSLTHISIVLNKLSLRFRDQKTPVLADISATFDSGAIHAIVGASGSGKSTLLSALLGLHPADHGKIIVRAEGLDDLVLIEQLKPHDWLTCCSYLSQSPFLFEGTIRDNLTLGIPGREIDLNRLRHLLSHLELTDVLGSNPLDFKLQEGGANLSGGQQQRIALVRALLDPRPVIVLDEATSALDERMRDLVFGILQDCRNDGALIFLVTHDTELSQRCDSCLDLSMMTHSSTAKS